MQNARCMALGLLIVLTAGLLHAADEKPKRSDAEIKAIAKIKELGGQVMELAQNDPRLEVSYHLTGGKVTDNDLQPLLALKDVVHLNLRGTDVTDAGLATVGK